MRCTDIKNLKMEHFHWEEKKLVFNQSKTRETVSLPLTPEVGWAVIDYLRHGRPQVDSPYLFVRHIAPFGPFSKDDHLNQIIKRYMELAHLPTLKKGGECIPFDIRWPVCCLKKKHLYPLFQIFLVMLTLIQLQFT